MAQAVKPALTLLFRTPPVSYSANWITRRQLKKQYNAYFRIPRILKFTTFPPSAPDPEHYPPFLPIQTHHHPSPYKQCFSFATQATLAKTDPTTPPPTTHKPLKPLVQGYETSNLTDAVGVIPFGKTN